MVRLVFRLGFAILVGTVAGQADEDGEWFERHIRPVLGAECWICHGAQLQQGGLRLDSRESMIEGGGRGPAVVPGDPGASVLLRALRQEGPQMPPTGPLSPETVAAFAKWIKDGAFWPSSGNLTSSLADEDRSADGHWAFQPVRKPEPPDVREESGLKNEVDRFVLAKLEELGWQPAAQAGRRSLIRRVSFDLTGLPPRPEAVEAFVRSTSPTAYDDLVDRLLESDRYGEHWARHWMDWVRYCESHGSQGDFGLPMAWRYRDYLIRAFNRDLAYDQLVREYFAGDLLENPRIDADSGLNESMHGPGNLRMVEYGYVPVDALEDQLKVVENQIEVFSKAFQGLTTSCARCHDHKFDPITQKDFFALYGVFASTRPGLVTVDSEALLSAGRDRLEALRHQIRVELAKAWKTTEISSVLRKAGDRLDRDNETSDEGSSDDKPDRRLEALVDLLEGLGPKAEHPLKPWLDLRHLEGPEFLEGWARVRSQWLEVAAERRASRASDFRPAWDLRRAGDYKQWFPSGPGVPETTDGDGEFRVLTAGDRILAGVLPAGVHTGLDSQKYGGILGSPRFRIDSDYISLKVTGTNFPYAKVIVENYPIGDGGIHPATDVESDAPHWIRFDTAYRKGQNAHLELQTLDDRSRKFRIRPKDPDRNSVEDGRSSFGILEVLFHDSEELPEDEPLAMLHLFEGPPPASVEALEHRYDRLVREAASDWQNGTLNSRQTAFLDSLIRPGTLPVTLDEVPRARALVEEYRAGERDAPKPRRAPGVLPGTSFDQPLFLQGDHTKPGLPVERRYLEFLGSRPFRERGSGRQALARAIASPSNPLTARVLVNRLWHYLFGKGIVETVDNFGTMGGRPSHPELLDYLADRFVAGGWSIKKMIRLLVQSRTYQMSTVASAEAIAEDPGNRYLQHQTARRLPAESIRDAILETSGDLDPTMYGPSINVYYVGKTEGGGPRGPLDGGRRRSVYQAIRRNAQNPFLKIFDSPEPSTTRGRRDVTNIPAQSLAMLNDPFVVSQSERWANRTLADGAISPRDRAERMFRRAVGRGPGPEETELLISSLEELARVREVPEAEWMGNQDLWKDLAQTLFNLKEFLYLR